jgi:hypothetical protein
MGRTSIRFRRVLKRIRKHAAGSIVRLWVDTEQIWLIATDLKYQYLSAIGDAFALATVAHVDGTSS